MTIKLLLAFVFFSIRIAWGLDGGAPLDVFDRANVGPPPSSQWSNPLISGQGGMKVLSNALVCNVAGLCSAWWNVADFPADMEVSVLWSDAVAATTSWVRLFLRTVFEGDAVNAAGYACQAVNDGSMFLRQVTGGGVGATLGSVPSGIPWASGDSVGCTMQGSNLCAWRKASGSSAWTQLVCATDTLIPAGGGAGVGLNALDVAVDNFYAGPLTTPRTRKYSILSFQ